MKAVFSCVIVRADARFFYLSGAHSGMLVFVPAHC
jgi:hypothetical protein